MPGRGDAYEKYLETLEHWRAQGWRVTAADWRGQAGSGRLGSDAVTGHIDDFALWVDDLAALLARLGAPSAPGRRCWSAIRWAGTGAARAGRTRDRAGPDALVLSAPMLDVLPGRVAARRCMHWRRAADARIGDPRRPAWKWSEKPGAAARRARRRC